MATKYLSASAALSAAVWRTAAGGGGSVTTIPVPGDDANLDSFTITIDQNWALDNILGAGAVAMSGSRSITVNNFGDAASTWTCTLNAAQTATLIGNVIAGGVSRFVLSGASTIVNHTGNTLGGTSGTSRSFNVTNGTLTSTGNPTGGSATNCSAIAATGAGAIVTINGDPVGGATINVGGFGVQVTAGAMTVNGRISGGSAASNASSGNFGALITGGTLTHNGDRVDTICSAVVWSGGTYVWTPNNSTVISIGGALLQNKRYAFGGLGGFRY